MEIPAIEVVDVTATAVAAGTDKVPMKVLKAAANSQQAP
jgi:hypothetical protein